MGEEGPEECREVSGDPFKLYMYFKSTCVCGGKGAPMLDLCGLCYDLCGEWGEAA